MGGLRVPAAAIGGSHPWSQVSALYRPIPTFIFYRIRFSIYSQFNRRVLSNLANAHALALAATGEDGPERNKKGLLGLYLELAKHRAQDLTLPRGGP